jgi:hypothetical protein
MRRAVCLLLSIQLIYWSLTASTHHGVFIFKIPTNVSVGSS